MAKIPDMFPELCNAFIISQRFAEILGKELTELRSVEEAHRHGELPTLGALIDIAIEQQSKADELIAGVPHWQVWFDSLIELISDNNRRLLRAVGDYISEQPQT
jgi:hypothetical protein